MKVDERETQESEGLQVHWALVKDPSERCPRSLVAIEQEEILCPSFIQFHLDSPSTIHRDDEAVRRCRLGKGPLNDRHQSGGRWNRPRTHLASALEGDGGRLGGVDAFPLQRTVGVKGLQPERMVFFDCWFRGKEVQCRCAQERARSWASSIYLESSAVGYPRYRKECELT